MARAAARPQVAGVGISHPERVLFPAAGATKLDLARYLRNNRTNTSIAAYSPRARPHAPAYGTAKQRLPRDAVRALEPM